MQYEKRRQMIVSEPLVIVHPDADTAAESTAQWLCELAEAAPDRFSIALAGGSTPRLLYGRLASEPLATRFPWHRVHWFFGDERFVPHDHPDSNFAMVRHAMLDRVGAPAANIHPIPTDLPTPEAAAEAYQDELRQHYGAYGEEARHLFDVVLLGVGEDGHTASLFPGSAALAEQHRWTASVVGAKPEPRVTLTFPALRSSRTVAFLVCGAGKREIVSAILSGADYPAGRVASDGAVRWILDRAAAPVE